MHTYIIITTLFTLCYSNMFRPSKSHHQGVRLIHFHSQNKQFCTTCKIQFIEQRVLCKAAAT